MTDEPLWKQPWAWRWRGWRRWHRLAIGPLCISIYPHRNRPTRPFIAHSWQFRNANGDMRHVKTFRAWLRAWRRSRS